jgi:hypothetical protein
MSIVSTPLAWDEVRTGATLQLAPIEVLEHIRVHSDLFAPVATLRPHPGVVGIALHRLAIRGRLLTVGFSLRTTGRAIVTAVVTSSRGQRLGRRAVRLEAGSWSLQRPLTQSSFVRSSSRPGLSVQLQRCLRDTWLAWAGYGCRRN